MAFVKRLRTAYVPELGQHITFVYHAFFRGKMSGLFTPKIFCKQHGDTDKVVFPYGYTIASNRDTMYTLMALRIQYGPGYSQCLHYTSMIVIEGTAFSYGIHPGFGDPPNKPTA